MGNEVLGEKAVKMNNLCLYPIKPIRSGEGLPYAPVDWPNLGDIWYWWLGNRTYHFGFYQDSFRTQMSMRSLLLLAGWFPLRGIAR